MRRGLVAACAVAAILCMTGCSLLGGTTTAAPETTVSTPRMFTAMVEKRTISDVLTVSFTTVAGADYSVSAPAADSLRALGNGYAFARSGGSAPRPISLPATRTEVSELVPLGVEVAAGTPVLSVHDSALMLKAALTPAQVLRIAGRPSTRTRAQIEGSSGPFDCSLADPRPTATNGDEYALYCRLPMKIPAVVGSSGILALTLAEAKDVPALPIEAVAGSRDDGLVYLKADASPHKVTLGISDGAPKRRTIESFSAENYMGNNSNT